MAKTFSNALALGFKAPSFALTDVISDKIVSLEDFPSDKPLVLMFICNHCPYVKLINAQLVKLVKVYEKKASFVAINSNDIAAYPEDSPENMKKLATEEGYSFPYLFDATQEIAKAYQAACTPDFYVFNEKRHLVYHGQFDDARPGNSQPIDGHNLAQALDALLSQQAPSAEQIPSLGCNIKWKS